MTPELYPSFPCAWRIPTQAGAEVRDLKIFFLLKLVAYLLRNNLHAKLRIQVILNSK
jgi:hypothetical protein